MRLYERIDGRLREFVLAQPVFFVATAPISPDGHVNVSPKGMRGTFTVLDEHRVAYLDHTGSGAETAAHLRENGRIVLMFCAFEGPPKVVRLHGRGRVVLPGTSEFADLLGRFDTGPLPGLRAIVHVDVRRVSDSCGYSVPLMDYVGDRDVGLRWAERKGGAGLHAYRAAKNARSVDGLPALDPPSAG